MQPFVRTKMCHHNFISIKRKKVFFNKLKKIEENLKLGNVSAEDIHRTDSVQHLRIIICLPKPGGKMKCETCKLVLISGPNIKNQLLTDEHFATVVQKAPRQKIMCVTCSKQFSEKTYSNPKLISTISRWLL